MASKQKKEALAALDEANKEYNKVCADLKDKYKELDKGSDAAIALISDVEELVGSIRRSPWSYMVVRHKIEVNVRKFVESRELKREERNKNIVAGVVAGGVAVGGVTFLAFMKDMFKKNIFLFIACLALSVFILAAFLVYKLFSGIKTAKKAYAQAKIIKEETIKNRTLFQQANALLKKIDANVEAVHSLYGALEKYVDCDFKQLPEETKDAFSKLYNVALMLAELVNTQIG